MLRGGLALAFAAMAAGLALRAFGGPHDERQVNVFDLFSAPMDIGERLIVLGIFVLALTPVARVVALVVIWIKERDYRFAVVATVVALTLGAAVLLGRV